MLKSLLFIDQNWATSCTVPSTAHAHHLRLNPKTQRDAGCTWEDISNKESPAELVLFLRMNSWDACGRNSMNSWLYESSEWFAEFPSFKLKTQVNEDVWRLCWETHNTNWTCINLFSSALKSIWCTSWTMHSAPLDVALSPQAFPTATSTAWTATAPFLRSKLCVAKVPKANESCQTIEAPNSPSREHTIHTHIGTPRLKWTDLTWNQSWPRKWPQPLIVGRCLMAKKTGLRHMHQGTLVAQPVGRKQHPQTSPSLKWNALNSGDLWEMHPF